MATPGFFPARYCRRVGRRGKDGEGEGEVEQEVVALNSYVPPLVPNLLAPCPSCAPEIPKPATPSCGAFCLAGQRVFALYLIALSVRY